MKAIIALVFHSQVKSGNIDSVDVTRLSSKAKSCCKAIGSVLDIGPNVPRANVLRVNGFGIIDVREQSGAILGSARNRGDGSESRCLTLSLNKEGACD